MITDVFQSIGIVLTIFVIVAIGLVTMYISYILGIGIIIITSVFIVYHILTTVKRHK